MTEINRSSLLAKLKHIKGMKLLVEQAVLLYLLMADEQTPMWVNGQRTRLFALSGRCRTGLYPRRGAHR